MSFGASTLIRKDNDRVIDGLRVPSTLDSVQNVTFVLTQEPGKLKPKDLKVAIERNRAEKEQRAEEQRKLRAEGGGAGMLDLRGILSEERMNTIEGDPFKRQLREMAFLADVDDVEKLEIEKGFRISEDYVGSDMLSEEDIAIVYKQRKVALLHKKRAEWRKMQSRMLTGLHPPTHPHIKAGTSADTARKILFLTKTRMDATTPSGFGTGVGIETESFASLAPPHFDPNRNDIWAKRMNTLRRFISSVSKWIVRKRVERRMRKVMELFHKNKCHTRAEIRAFIESDKAKRNNSQPGSTAAGGAARSSNGSAASNPTASSSADRTRPASLSAMVFSEPNPALAAREHRESVMAARLESIERGEPEVTRGMARKMLFPQCNPSFGGTSSLELLPAPDPHDLIKFDDFTYFQLQPWEPEFAAWRHQEHPIPLNPIYYPPWKNKEKMSGAPEELSFRPPADAKVTEDQITSWIPTEQLSGEPDIIKKLRASAVPLEPPEKKPQFDGLTSPLVKTSPSDVPGLLINGSTDKKNNNEKSEDKTAAIVDAMPIWLTSGEDEWTTTDVDFLCPRSGLRVFGQVPRRSELDVDWILRPDSETLVYERDESLRSTWCSKPGFSSANIYLLGNQESRNRDAPPPSGPNLSTDYYLPDEDRHRSGLSCFSRDHRRSAAERDPEVPPLQQALDKKDYLTDSESDNEDGYGDFKPSVQRVRKILQPPPPAKVEEAAVPAGKGGKDAKKGKGAPAPAPAPAAAPLTSDTMQSEAFSTVLDEGQRREEQVELLRDRKTLDLESTILRARKSRQDELTKRLCELSAMSRCLVLALPVQVPFHSYEEEVYALVEPRMPLMNPLHVEVDLSRSNESLPNMSLPLSPLKIQ